MKEGMSKPRTIPRGFISSVPASDDVDSVRPGDDKTWTVAKVSKPEIVIALAPVGEEGVLVGRVVVKGEDMPGVTVFVKTSEKDDFKAVSTDKNGEPKVSTEQASQFKAKALIDFINCMCWLLKS